MMAGRASGVWRAALWNRTMDPGWTFPVTRRVISPADRSFQSRESPSVTKESFCKGRTGRTHGRNFEDIGGGLVDGHRPGIGGGVGLFLTHMELQGLKFIAHGKYPFFLLLKQAYSYILALLIGIFLFLEILFTPWYDRTK